ncbi:MAG: hypothetical protein V3W41_05245 [Planctomycetota bacterium]
MLPHPTVLTKGSDYWWIDGRRRRRSPVPQGILVSGLDSRGHSLVTWYGTKEPTKSRSLARKQLADFGPDRRISRWN